MSRCRPVLVSIVGQFWIDWVVFATFHAAVRYCLAARTESSRSMSDWVLKGYTV